MTIKRVLLACRGEIALRFIRTAKRLNIETISVYTDEERQASFVLAADHRVRSDAANPYASPEALLAIAKNWKADAIAPGYGPLAENADFAAACGSAGLIFIGPHPDALLLAGDKVRARDLARDAGLPVIPGGAVATLEAAIVLAEEIGFPVLLKAVAGGGGGVSVLPPLCRILRPPGKKSISRAASLSAVPESISSVIWATISGTSKSR
ncbi:biotin carboxylase N-terminal domain-containing protein (plasmid) [Sinorhizobium medicae]|nr:biotin carboxylase N-terminal domain-containing protein [Sinorhizobium medicae]WQO48965.1 biotin carboxylase N-terminal domain-containing protein [Sinorhizobium medicae]WQO70574.1 biotin carboxylase N-terminal domain-containing protein [Sinorhizobium medicae]